MTNPSDFEIKYWAGGNNFSEIPQTPKRSIKRKLVIVFCFIGVLALTPAIIFGLSSLDLSKGEKVSVAKTPKTQSETHPVTIEEPKSAQTTKVEVINNDSYWKISKRACGTGKYYLSVRDQNEGRALYIGETVTVTCSL